jgi:hypothetical protein
MSTSSSDRIHQIYSGSVAVGLSTLIGVSAMSGQNAILIKYASGGSLEIGGITTYAGSTFTWGGGYLFSSGEVLSINTGGNIYLKATGATALAYIIRTITG